MTTRAPGNELRKRQRIDIVYKLLNNQVIREAEIRGGKSQFGEGKIKTVHAKCDFVSQFTEIRLLEAGTIADNESAFALMNILPFGETLDTLTSPGMKIGTGKFRDTPERIISISSKKPKGLRKDLFNRVPHDFLDFVVEFQSGN